MLVIAVDTISSTPGRPVWSARRHDDDGPDHSGRLTDEGLFEAVFHALHDGEQISIGLDCELTAPVPDGPARDGAPAPDQAGAASADSAGVAALTALLDEIGMWRSWTVVTTSVERWKATTSILVWQAAGRAASAQPGDRSFADSAIEAFYGSLFDADAPAADGGSAAVLNLVAAVAQRAGLQVDAAELRRPVVSIATGVPAA